MLDDSERKQLRTLHEFPSALSLANITWGDAQFYETLALADDYLYSRDIDAMIEDVHANIETLAESSEELTPAQRLELRTIMRTISEVVE